MLVFFILFLIYIRRIFEQVEREFPEIVSLLLIDNLAFIALKMSINNIVKVYGKVNNLVVEWRQKNAVIYNTAKTKLVLFSCARQQRLN